MGRLTYLLNSRVTLLVKGNLISITEFSRGHAMFMKGTLFARCIQRTSNVKVQGLRGPWMLSGNSTENSWHVAFWFRSLVWSTVVTYPT